MRYTKEKIELEENGYSVLSNLYSEKEISKMLSCIENAEQDESSFMKTKDLFAIRQLIKNVPLLPDLLFNEKMTKLISELYQSQCFLTKAIYFDKPSKSNWFVAYHQDLSISVDKKADLEQYVNWTFKKGQFGVQPPIAILQDTITIRIHLDRTDRNNGALKVIPKSHLNGVVRTESKDWNIDNEFLCDVERGGAMLMKPLTLHASNRTTNGKQRRVIHLEFNKHNLKEPLDWLEYYRIEKIVDKSRQIS
ncbi:MAG: phytanoyl-CoA dioxygenase [Zunongwangia sp.]|uniref:Phytanoyl-CoA dioxygenase n=1 Tax=Zunongwangia profunda (strain DSM 18752 / CCTCC AB 206139 / SM-A87) TaxID=655815 RepID=D5BBR1_ZUNPS|nr:phytanoyl-CoA dioxygenase family protein [Zunongwangia profunda]ADF52510.1 phytanoyl-CoA dioxygenase [Zunongwangia profunda SM-A87]MAO36360.1 phytanoyl-CoA dioxygenase [Zunongwangia sp.]MAS70935.1 phytanoyl-CoA dioxygenase [Zunongwangia sp.]|tara:strand:+ start:1238 stop:1987 length:750 start_codon:yes stop_codon:yes gene_type:complete